MSKFAAQTQVDAGRSRAEIEKTLVRYGADGFGYGWDKGIAVITFRLSGNAVRFTLTMPDIKSDEFQKTDKGRPRKHDAIVKSWEQAQRQRWRALLLVVKAKLEAVDSGITTFQEEFLAHLLLPDGQTVGQYTLPQIEKIKLGGKKMPGLLPGGK